jgi:hypothetical protein
VFDHWFIDPYVDARDSFYWAAEPWPDLIPEHATFENYGPSDIGRVMDLAPQRLHEGDEDVAA